MARLPIQSSRNPVMFAATFGPIVMSLLAMAVVAWGAWRFGASPPRDEGLEAHVYQLLMVAQAPLLAVLVAAHWRSPRASVRVVTVQLGLWLAALAALYVSGLG